jgi:heme exporter protein D
MGSKRDQRKPTFLWQAVLILLPVIVLAAVGWASLRQDRVLVQHEATERAHQQRTGAFETILFPGQQYGATDFPTTLRPCSQAEAF